MINLRNLNPNVNIFAFSGIESNGEVNKLSKEILSIAPSIESTISPTQQSKTAVTNINNINTPAVKPDITMFGAEANLTANISKQIATNQSGLGVNLSEKAQEAINMLRANSAHYNAAVKTDDKMNGKIFIAEASKAEDLKNIFSLPNPIKSFETVSLALDSKKSGNGGFSLFKGDEEKQQKQKNSLNLVI